jgi:hypothetical protein
MVAETVGGVSHWAAKYDQEKLIAAAAVALCPAAASDAAAAVALCPAAASDAAAAVALCPAAASDASISASAASASGVKTV